MKESKSKNVLVAISSVLFTLIVIGGVYLYLNRSYYLGEGSVTQRPFIERETDYYKADEIAGHIHQPNAKREFPWEEHSTGIMLITTNNLGFREDADTPKTKPANTTRILVTGDSHTDGVVHNAESFSNQLEHLLASEYPNRQFEVVNGGVGYYAPQNYAGFIERFAYLKPDVFILTIYTGNDFIDAVEVAHQRGKIAAPTRPDDYFIKLKQVQQILPGFIPQAFNQVVLFKQFPEMRTKALEITQTHLKQIQDICVEQNIDFLVMLLPTKVDVEMQSDNLVFNDVKKILTLSNEDFTINQQVTKALSDWLSQEGIAHLNLLEEMTGESVELYWQKDYHLNDKGHQVVANILYRSPFKSMLVQQ